MLPVYEWHRTAKTALEKIDLIYAINHGVRVYRPTFLQKRSEISMFSRPGGVGIELGVAEGEFSEELLRLGNLSKLYGVDMYAGDRGHDDEQFGRAKRRMQRFGAAYELIKATFDDALDLFPDGFFDFVYIDGYAHTGQDEGKTLHTWLPKVKSSGIIAGDDFSNHFPAVVREVTKFTNLNRLELNIVAFKERTNWASLHPSWYCRVP